MNDAPHRRERKLELSVAPGPGQQARRLRFALLTGVVALRALVIAPAAGAVTGGAASSVPVTAEAETTEAAPVIPTVPGEVVTPVFNEAELSFTPFRYAGASWYDGKTMWGRTTACGEILRPTTIGVANKTLPCGTPVKFSWHGRTIVAPVIDRGPYVKGRSWDLTSAAAEALAFEGVGNIQYAVALEYAAAGLRHAPASK